MVSSLFVLLLLASRLRMFDRLGEIAPKRFRPLQSDMQTHGTGIDAEVDRRVRSRRLHAHDLCRNDETLMPAPAHAEPEELKAVGEGRDIDALAEDEGEQARRALQPRRQPIAEAGVL